MTYEDVLAFAQEIAQSEAGENQSAKELIDQARQDLTRPEYEPIEPTNPDYWQAVYDRIDANTSYFYGSWI